MECLSSTVFFFYGLSVVLFDVVEVTVVLVWFIPRRTSRWLFSSGLCKNTDFASMERALRVACLARGACEAFLTYHSYGEVVVDDAVGDWVALLLLVFGDDVDVPAVQHQLDAVLDVPQGLQHAAPLVACRKHTGVGRVQYSRAQ